MWLEPGLVNPGFSDSAVFDALCSFGGSDGPLGWNHLFAIRRRLDFLCAPPGKALQ